MTVDDSKQLQVEERLANFGKSKQMLDQLVIE